MLEYFKPTTSVSASLSTTSYPQTKNSSVVCKSLTTQSFDFCTSRVVDIVRLKFFASSMKSWRGNDLFIVLVEYLWQVSNSPLRIYANDISWTLLIDCIHCNCLPWCRGRSWKVARIEEEAVIAYCICR